METEIKRRFRLWGNIVVKGLLAVIFFTLCLTLKNPVTMKAQAYGLARETMKKTMEMRTFNWYAIEGRSFRVKYQPVDAPVARLVLETAEAAFAPVNELLAYEPSEPIPIYIYPSAAALNKSFGWDAAVNAMGVYWAGTIRILSPLDWIQDEAKLSEIFQQNGPIAHEYAHLLVDYRTHGNYPRWLTEGIAQYVERELTGFQLTANEAAGQTLYAFAAMDGGFDLLPNQNLAYEQSLLAVDYLTEMAGFDAVLQILDQLALGKKIGEALQAAVGQDEATFERKFREWVAVQDH